MLLLSCQPKDRTKRLSLTLSFVRPLYVLQPPHTFFLALFSCFQSGELGTVPEMVGHTWSKFGLWIAWTDAWLKGSGPHDLTLSFPCEAANGGNEWPYHSAQLTVNGQCMPGPSRVWLFANSMWSAPPGSSAYEIFQARIQEWAVSFLLQGIFCLWIEPISSSPHVFRSAVWFFTTEPSGFPSGCTNSYYQEWW